MTKATFNPGTASGVIQTQNSVVLAYLRGLPTPDNVQGLPGDAEWAVKTGPDTYEVSHSAFKEMYYLSGYAERPDPTAPPSGPLFYG